ncbi:tetratricopeptide repeat protein [Ruegeria arenilitoris]|uniref:tetratricopeptide repeat protein n=1 Tax=Ruegeria arenilitoris TaxID=1173585 RepID=UPI001480C6D5|nr:hypothetical protein [Ruegeria arenilitoris]
MRIRLAALTTFLAAGIIWFGGSPKPDDLAATCINSKATRSERIAACTTLIGQDDTAPVYRHLFLTRRAWAHSYNGHYERALADVNHAMELQPENYQTWVMRAQIKSASGDHDAALADYDRVSQAFPEKGYVTWEKAKFLEGTGEREAALAIYERLHADYPNISEVAEKIASYHTDSGNHELAFGLVSKAAVRWPEQAWVYDQLFMLHILYSGDAESALKAAKTRAELQPDVYFELLSPVAVHLTVGDEQEGILYADQYIKWRADKATAELSWLNRIRRTFSNPSWEQEYVLAYRPFLYETFGRRDLAREAFRSYFEETNQDAEQGMINALENSGLTPSIDKSSDRNSRIDQLIDQYFDHDDLKLSWLPRRDG